MKKRIKIGQMSNSQLYIEWPPIAMNIAMRSGIGNARFSNMPMFLSACSSSRPPLEFYGKPIY